MVLLIEENVKEYIGSGQFPFVAFYDSGEDVIYMAEKLRPLFYCHEYLHFLFYKLPAELSHTLNLLLDLIDIVFSPVSLAKLGPIGLFKSIWREYRLEYEEELITRIYFPDCEDDEENND